MKNYPAPTCIKELQQFLGFLEYSNMFFRSFAHMVLSISTIIVVITMDLGNIAIVGLWERKVIVVQLQYLPNFSKSFDLFIDALKKAIGGALM